MLYWLLMMTMMVIISNNDKLQIVSANCARRLVQTMFWLTLSEFYQTIWPIIVRRLESLNSNNQSQLAAPRAPTITAVLAASAENQYLLLPHQTIVEQVASGNSLAGQAQQTQALHHQAAETSTAAALVLAAAAAATLTNRRRSQIPVQLVRTR